MKNNPILIGMVIRKIDITPNGTRRHPSEKNLNLQIITFHRKLKKGGRPVVTEFSIEKDHDEQLTKYHAHLIVQINPESITHLFEHAVKFISMESYENKEDENTMVIRGKYGNIDFHKIHDLKKFRQYINKISPSRTLI